VDGFAQYPPQLRSLLGKLARTELGALLLDETHGDRYVHQALAEADDPMLREIGTQLRDAAATPRQIAASPCYRQVLERGLANLERLDVDRIERDLDAALDTAADDPPRDDPQPDTRRHDDPRRHDAGRVSGEDRSDDQARTRW